MDVPGQRLLHGEAVALGMVCEAWLSVKRTGLSSSDYQIIRDKIFSLYKTIQIPVDKYFEIASLAIQDKKNENNVIKISLLEKIGKCTYDIPVSVEEIVEAMKEGL